MNKFVVILLSLIACSSGAIGFHYLTKPAQPEFALYYQPSRSLAAFNLNDQFGQQFSKQSLQDKWSFVFLGYTSCPDVCPTSLQSLNFIYADLKAINPNSQVLLVTADPKRDSQEKLAQYIAYFNEEFIALRAEHDELFPFTRSLGLMYSITEESDPQSHGHYQVDHSASLVLINPDGNIAAIFKPEQTLGQIPQVNTDKLLSDYKKIVALYES